MIEFVELRITPDGKTLVIEVKIKDEAYYTNVYLDTITIDTQDTYSASSSSNPVFTHTFISDTKTYSIELNAVAMNLTDMNQLFFVKVTAKGTPSSDTPCGKDINCVTCAVANMYPLYQYGMGLTKELTESCSIPQGFTDFILRKDAIEVAVKTGNFTEAAKYYKMFVRGIKASDISIRGGCGCGR